MQHKPRRQNNNNNGGGHGGGGRPYQNNNNNNRGRRYSKPYGNSGSSGGENDAGNVSRVRRNAQTNREKFMNMASDAMRSGDRVLAEYYLQHAEHYFRVLSALPPEEVRQQRHYNQPVQSADGQPQQDNNDQQNTQENNQQQSSESRHEQHHDERHEEPVVDTSGTALPSFITGVREMPRDTRPVDEN